MLSFSYLFEGIIDSYRRSQENLKQQRDDAVNAGLNIVRRVIPNKHVNKLDKAVEIGKDVKTVLSGLK